MSEEDDSPTLFDVTDPPMKKARYLWQISGRYHLTQDEPEIEHNQCSADDEEEDAYFMERNISIIRWQTQQVAKAVFDNTINSMIESMGFPIPDLDNFYMDYNTNGNLEDEAVKMAIRSHGLQKPCSCSEQRHIRPLPTNIPFHQRNHFDGPSTSSFTVKSQLEDDILSEAVSVAIQNKGLGASQNNER